MARNYIAIEKSTFLCLKLITLYSLSHLHTYCDFAQLQYDATKSYDLNQIMSDIVLALSGLKVEYHFERKLITLTP